METAKVKLASFVPAYILVTNTVSKTSESHSIPYSTNRDPKWVVGILYKGIKADLDIHVLRHIYIYRRWKGWGYEAAAPPNFKGAP